MRAKRRAVHIAVVDTQMCMRVNTIQKKHALHAFLWLCSHSNSSTDGCSCAQGDRGQQRAEWQGGFDGAGMVHGKKGGLVRVGGY